MGSGRRRLLVVDDEAVLGTMISRMLQPEYDVEVVADARQALVRLAATGADPFDAVLCDLMMPEITGMDLYAEVASRYPGLERRFVFMTGGAFTAGASRFLAIVQNPRLQKPFALGALKEAIAGAVG
jgi:CheY-like chemotaxis protein